MTPNGYPPGHPTGSETHTGSMICPCGEYVELAEEVERDTNAATLYVDGEESDGSCPNCGKPLDTDSVSWESG